MAPLLELHEVSKHYGAVEALSKVSLSLESGKVLGLMGDNGAGKSTLIKIISGVTEPTAGTMIFDAHTRNFIDPSEARSAGIETVYQDLALCPNLTAAQNIFLGRQPMRSVLGMQFIVDHRAMLEESNKLFARLDSNTPADALVRNLSGGQRQAVAIARTLASKARLVIFDEPTAAISVRQISQVLALIRKLAQSGISIILISHRMPDVFETCDQVMVLRRGEKVADKPIGESSPEEVTALITGALECA